MPRPSHKRPVALLAGAPRRPVPLSSAVHPDDSPAAAQIISAAVVAMAANGYHGTSVATGQAASATRSRLNVRAVRR